MDLSGLDITTLELLSYSTNMFFVITKDLSEESYFCTSNVKQISGYSLEEIKSFPQKHYSLISEEDREAVNKILADIEKDTTTNSIELSYRIKSKAGNNIWLKENLVLHRNHDNKIKERTSAVSDITKLKQSEFDAKKQIEALKELNTNKDKFINIVSHDLRSPFTTLLGFSEILLNEPDISEEERSEYLQYIYDSSKSQLDYINCLLDWSRLQTGRVKVEPSRLNVKNTIANAVAPLTGAAVRKNIDIKIDVSSDLFINADERLISQAIIHLTSNAIKFSTGEKTVFLSSSRFKEGMIEIIVRDEGCGISEENQQKLFRIDQKLVLPGTNGEKGSGMGLTLTKEIIDKHGGQIWFYTQTDEGSEFHLTVPEAKNNVLIVENNDNIFNSYKEVIESNFSNFEVQAAKNGYEAIKIIREILPTVIITNHDMPLMDGVHFVEAINNRESGKNITIIIISKKINEEIKRSYYKLGVDRIISNPADIEKLIDNLKELLFQS